MLFSLLYAVNPISSSIVLQSPNTTINVINTIKIQTHAINGLHESDFVLAAKIDRLA